MAYGISVENASAKLVLSSDGLVLGYLGKATHSSTTAPTATANGYSTYTFSHAGKIVPAIKLVTNYNSLLLSMSQAGSTWTITLYHGTGTDANGFQPQSTADVYVWGLPVSVSGYGMAMYDAGGNLTADLSKRPLSILQKIDWGTTTVTESIAGGITTPAVIGMLHDWQRIRSGSGPTWNFNYDSGAWGRSSTDVRRDWIQRRQALGEDTGDPTSTQRRAVRGIVVDVNGLT